MDIFRLSTTHINTQQMPVSEVTKPDHVMSNGTKFKKHVADRTIAVMTEWNSKGETRLLYFYKWYTKITKIGIRLLMFRCKHDEDKPQNSTSYEKKLGKLNIQKAHFELFLKSFIFTDYNTLIIYTKAGPLFIRWGKLERAPHTVIF